MQPISSNTYPHSYSPSRPVNVSSSTVNQYQYGRFNQKNYPSNINSNYIPQQYSGIQQVSQPNYRPQVHPSYRSEVPNQFPQSSYRNPQYNQPYQQWKPPQNNSVQYSTRQQQFIPGPYQSTNLVRWNDKNESRMQINEQNIIPNVGFSNPAFENQQPNDNETFQKGMDENYFKKRFPDPDIKYKILSVMDTKKSLDVTSVTDPDKDLRKGDAIIWEYHGGPNQNFYLKPMGNKKFKLINAATGFPLKVQDSSPTDGAIIKSNPNAETQNELFGLLSHEGKYKKQHIYQIETFCGKVLDCKDQHSRNGTNVIQWSSNKGKNQLWLIQPA